MGRKIILVLIGLSLALGGFSQLAHSKKAEENDYSIIWKRNLFCLPDKSEKPKSILKPVVTPLNQRIALKGIITKENPLENLAVIEELLTRKESLYRVGEKVSGAQITSISQGRVDFLDHNNPETLFFFEQKPLGKKVILSSLQKDAITHVPKKLNLAEAIKDLRTNFKLYSRIIVAPAMNREKKVNGYRIANIPKKALLQQWVLRIMMLSPM